MKAGSDYAYLVGRVRALERSLLEPKTLDALLRAEDLEQALRVVAEIPYLGEAFQSISPTPKTIDKALTEHFFGIVSDFAKSQGGEEITAFFLLGFDVTALKLAVKHFMARRPLEWTYLGSLDPRRVLRFLSGETEYLPDPLARTLREVQELLEARPGYAQGVEFLLDRFFLKQVYNLAERAEGLLKKWYQAFVIFSYLRGTFRARYEERKPDVLRLLYFANPLVREKDLVELLSLPEDKVPDYLDYLGFVSVLPEGGTFRDDPYYLAEIERRMDNELLFWVRKYRRETFGPEPVFGFLFAKSIDVKNLRILLEGKYFQIEGDILRRKLRECYYEQ